MRTLLQNGYRHIFTTLSGAVIAALLHFTGQPGLKQAVLQILVFVLGWISKNPGSG